MESVDQGTEHVQEKPAEGAGETQEVPNLEEENKLLKEKVTELESQLKEIQNAARIIKANFENYKLDVERQIREVSKSSVLRFVKILLPVVDDFKRAFAYYEQTKDLEEFYKGITKIYEKFLKILENEGLKVIDTSGKFDPFLHEAFEKEERDDVEEYTILSVIEDGYIFNGQVVKPAKVKVSVRPREQK
ncbi:nucleotide exchange factor GrpE [Fervidobacterium thailandense]|uniref:Protein GrpE n=2 Tax=Fervidobacterium thailandense TaxID=1008305 RepID=A0A1E3G598_9BACT|nr:nucleotide exchange factor GrpE [Fervidobacterium thailandense]